jgi:hypothetical protein
MYPPGLKAMRSGKKVRRVPLGRPYFFDVIIGAPREGLARLCPGGRRPGGYISCSYDREMFCFRWQRQWRYVGEDGGRV